MPPNSPQTPTGDWLTSIANVEAMLGTSFTGSSILIPLLISEVSALMIESMNRTHFLMSNGNNPVVDYLSGTGDNWLTVRQWPVRQLLYTGTVTQNSTAVTGMTTTANLFVNQTVAGYGPSSAGSQAIAVGTTVAAINGSTGVTLSQPAVASGTFQLVFGIALFADQYGYFGSNPNGFMSQTQLQNGTQYALRVDQPNGLDSKSGMISNLTQGFWTTWRTDGGALSPYNIGGLGNVQCQYNCGFYSIPSDLELACLRVIAKAKNSKKFGMPVTNASYEDFSIGFQAAKSTWLGLIDGEAGAVLARYRVIQTGSIDG